MPLFLALQDLQGKVELYFLTVNSTQKSQTLKLDPSVTSVLISDLQPNTEYTLSLTASNGAHNITSSQVTCTTADGGEFKETGRPVYQFWFLFSSFFMKAMKTNTFSVLLLILSILQSSQGGLMV